MQYLTTREKGQVLDFDQMEANPERFNSKWYF